MIKITDIYNKSSNKPLYPIWLMRQAGRYLPEYRDLRSKTPSFLDLCYNSDLAFEASMQPLRRFDLSAAILFSDILVIPHILGFNLNFQPQHGPILQKINLQDIKKLKNIDLTKYVDKLSPSFDTLNKLSNKLSPHKDIIGFSGAPWTLATYMIAGKSSSDQLDARLFSLKYRQDFLDLINILTDFISLYLVKQIEAGANVVQIFDSWAGILGYEDLYNFCIRPISKIITKIKKQYPNIPIISFPKGINNYLKEFVEETKTDILSVDWRADFITLQKLQNNVIIQGNLDPAVLLAGGDILNYKIDEILTKLGNKSFIFNLGHGILPQTPIENIEFLVNKIKNSNNKNN